MTALRRMHRGERDFSTVRILVAASRSTVIHNYKRTVEPAQFDVERKMVQHRCKGSLETEKWTPTRRLKPHCCRGSSRHHGHFLVFWRKSHNGNVGGKASVIELVVVISHHRRPAGLILPAGQRWRGRRTHELHTTSSDRPGPRNN